MICFFLMCLLNTLDVNYLWSTITFNGVEIKTYQQTIDNYVVENSLIKKGIYNGQIIFEHKKTIPGVQEFSQVLLSEIDVIKQIQSSNQWSALTHVSDPVIVIYAGENLDQNPVKVWKVTASDSIETPTFSYTFFIDVATGEYAGIKDEILFEDIRGHIDGYITPGTLPDITSNPPVLSPIDTIRVASSSSETFTDSHGDFLFDYDSHSPVDLTVSANSLWTNVVSVINPTLSESRTVVPPGPVFFVLNDELKKEDTAQINALVHVNLIHDFFTRRTDWDGINISIRSNVNIDRTCNAYFSGNTINFFRQGGGCVNTAYSSVVAHEYGHFIVNRLGLTQAAFGEGFSDVCSMLLYDDPIVGRNFFINGDYVRYPAESGMQCPCIWDNHRCGQVLGSIWWRLREAFGSMYGNEEGLEIVRQMFVDWSMITSGGFMTFAATRCTATEILIVDDDDGNLLNGTPHFEIIKDIFESHNIKCMPLNLCTAGDFDGNNRVDAIDLNIFLDNYGTKNLEYDINEDGQIDIDDLAIILSLYQTLC